MKKSCAPVLGALAVVLLALPTNAAPTVPNPAATPRLPFKIVSLKPAGPVNGSFTLDVGIENTGIVPADIDIDIGGFVHPQPKPPNKGPLPLTHIDVNAVGHIQRSGPQAMFPPTCGNAKQDYAITVKSGGTDYPLHAGVRASNCGFATTVTPAFNGATADYIHSQTLHAVFIQSVHVDTAQACGTRGVVTMTLLNNGQDQHGMMLAVKENDTILGQMKGVDMAHGATRAVTITLDRPITSHAIATIVDGAVGAVDSSIHLWVNTTCTYTTE